MTFIDEARIRAIGGRGGNGAIHWRREKYLPNGGPDGGNGGDGGAVIFVCDESYNSLLHFRNASEFKAPDGEAGGANRRTGAAGKDLYCPVPLGTQFYYEGALVADLSRPGALWIGARGGRGGKGNANFKSSTKRAPAFAQAGSGGECWQFTLVLKCVADVGLIGLPNAGKSTLLSSISRATPKIADYPFTTLMPSLGVVETGESGRFIVADIPGIIEDAHKGKGLGLQFLRHIERTRVLCFVVDPGLLTTSNEAEEMAEACVQQVQMLSDEMFKHNEAMINRPKVLAISKADLRANHNLSPALLSLINFKDTPIVEISSKTKQGLDELCRLLAECAKTDSINTD